MNASSELSDEFSLLAFDLFEKSLAGVAPLGMFGDFDGLRFRQQTFNKQSQSVRLRADRGTQRRRFRIHNRNLRTFVRKFVSMFIPAGSPRRHNRPSSTHQPPGSVFCMIVAAQHKNTA